MKVRGPKSLETLRALLPGGKIGCADLSSMSLPFPRGLTLLLPLSRDIVQSGDEGAFYRHQVLELGDTLARALDACACLIKNWGFRVLPVGSDQDERTLSAPISHKAVARLSGLGWIGKNSLLVSPEYGPSIRLGTILTDAPFPTGTPLSERCGDCEACRNACPVRAICGLSWSHDLSRDALIDPFLCNDYRMRHAPAPGRKHACGECIRACPFT